MSKSRWTVTVQGWANDEEFVALKTTSDDLWIALREVSSLSETYDDTPCYVLSEYEMKHKEQNHGERTDND